MDIYDILYVKHERLNHVQTLHKYGGSSTEAVSIPL